MLILQVMCFVYGISSRITAPNWSSSNIKWSCLTKSKWPFFDLIMFIKRYIFIGQKLIKFFVYNNHENGHKINFCLKKKWSKMKRIIIDNSYVFYLKFFKINAINYNLIFMQSKLVSIVFHDKISFTFVLGMSYRLLTNSKKEEQRDRKK